MSASAQVRRERAELADLLDELGPDAPTLCEGWATRDLAAHLVVREARPDAAIGVRGGPTAGWTQHLQDAEARHDYASIVDKVRNGPPALSVFSLPGADGLMNLFEYSVHHEDVRRAQEGWQPRTLPDELSDGLWGKLRLPAGGAFRRSPTGVTLVRSDTGRSMVAHKGEPMVEVTGSVIDLVVLAFGRRAVQVDVTGDPAAVAAFTEKYLA